MPWSQVTASRGVRGVSCAKACVIISKTGGPLRVDAITPQAGSTPWGTAAMLAVLTGTKAHRQATKERGTSKGWAETFAPATFLVRASPRLTRQRASADGGVVESDSGSARLGRAKVPSPNTQGASALAGLDLLTLERVRVIARPSLPRAGVIKAPSVTLSDFGTSKGPRNTNGPHHALVPPDAKELAGIKDDQSRANGAEHTRTNATTSELLFLRAAPSVSEGIAKVFAYA